MRGTAIITEHRESDAPRRGRRLLYFFGLWLAGVVTAVSVATLLHLIIGALYQL